MADADASWLIKVTTRFITLKKDNKITAAGEMPQPRERARSVANLFSLLINDVVIRVLVWEQKDSQPEKDSEARDVEVPLGSEKLHVQVIKHVRLQLRICASFFA